MMKKLFIAILILVTFYLLNYVLAFFAPSPWEFPKPVWIYSNDTVKKQFFKNLAWQEKVLTVTMTYEGGNIENGMGGIRTEASQVGTPEFIEENKLRMEKVGKCTFNGKEGYWEFYVQTYSFFNIPLKSETINCNNGLI